MGGEERDIEGGRGGEGQSIKVRIEIGTFAGKHGAREDEYDAEEGG